MKTNTKIIKEAKHPDRLRRSSPLEEGNKNSSSSKGCKAKPDGLVFATQEKIKWHNLPFNPNLKQRAKELRKAGNLSEVLFWQNVKNKKFLGLDFDRQKIIGNYIVDFFCKDIGFVIEIDGESHDNKEEYDKKRDQYLQSLGLKVIRILDIDVKRDIEGVFSFLEGEVKKYFRENTRSPSLSTF